MVQGFLSGYNISGQKRPIVLLFRRRGLLAQLPMIGFQENDQDSFRGHSLDGSFRRSKAGISPDRRSCVSAASRSLHLSRRVFKGLKYYMKTLIDSETFSNNIKDWVLERTPTHSTNRKLFGSPFMVDELCKLDYALEGVLFQQLFRMPYSLNASDDVKECQFLALEDLLYTIISGLWRTFWHKTGPLPFSVSCPCRPGSKFYIVEKAMSMGRVGHLCGAAIVAKSKDDREVQWGHVVELALFKADIACGNDISLSASTICEALFYGFHILLSRSLSRLNILSSDPIYLLVLDSKYGGVVSFAGDLSKLETNSSNPYKSVAKWINVHAEVSVSPIDRIWNKLGNANWGDLGTLHLLLATFNSIVHWKGPPRKSIASLAADHSLRLHRRRIECNGLVPTRKNIHDDKREIIEFESETDCSFKEQTSCLKLKPGSMVALEDPKWQKGFQIQEILPNRAYLSYSAISVGLPGKLLTVYVGAHSSKLEPSWEAMSLWYQVQRQTKVLNIMKQRGISSRYLPEIVASGRILHPGPCRKQNPSDCCDHPLCGTPVLVTSPVGEVVSSVIAQYGSFSPDEALRLCRDSVMALRIVALANIQHGDICPENILQVENSMSGSGSLFVLMSWGRAILEDRDSPTMNLQFSSMHALRHRKLCPSSDVESLIYLLYFVSGGAMQQQESIESALQWREICWSKRIFQQQLGEVSTLLKAFADYVDSLCGTPYPVEYDFWLNRLNQAMTGLDKGKAIDRVEICLKLEDVAESSCTSGGDAFSPT